MLGKPSWDVACQLVALMCFVLPHAWHLEQRALIEAWLNNNLCLFCCGGPGADGTRDKLMNVWQRLSTFHRPANQYISRRLGCCPVLLSWGSLSSALQFAVIFTELIHQVKASSCVLLGLWYLVFKNWNGGMISFFCLCEVWNCHIIWSRVRPQWRQAGSLPWNDLFPNSYPKFLMCTIVWDKSKLLSLNIKPFHSEGLKFHWKL